MHSFLLFRNARGGFGGPTCGGGQQKAFINCGNKVVVTKYVFTVRTSCVIFNLYYLWEVLENE